MTEQVDVAAVIRAGGGRMTAPRRALVSALASATGHVTAEDLIERVQREVPGVDRSTVYRNLAALEDAGVIYHVHLAHGPSVYHLSGADEVHAHAVCDDCGAVVEVPVRPLRRLARQLADEGGFLLGRQHFALTGRCRGCV